jgi:hypothetical protein
MSIKVDHSYGFFSCCSVRLYEIIKFANTYKILPEVDSHQSFHLYKKDEKDVTFIFFNHYDVTQKMIDKYIYITAWNFQFDDYKSVDYDSILPYVKNYFSPSSLILNKKKELTLKYNISEENCIGVYFRGTDKKKEIHEDSPENYYLKIKEIVDKYKDMQLLIQTDSSPFLDYMKDKFPNTIIIHENHTSYKDYGIHYEKTKTENHEDIINLFATFLILSKCKYLVCSSGNCSIWMMYYREHANNVFQNIRGHWKY